MRQSAFILLIGLLASCGAPPATSKMSMPPPMVGVASPIERDLPVVRELTGQVEAVETVQLQPQIGGPVVKVYVKDGSDVKVGQPLIDIDPRPFVALLNAARAQVQSAAAHLVTTQSNYKRSLPLQDQKIISEQALSDIYAAQEVAVADLDLAKANQVTAQLNLGYAHVVSPISGRIDRISSTVGNVVIAGGLGPGTIITTIVSLDPIYVTFDLDEQTWREIGQHLRSSGDATGGAAVPVSIQLEGESDFGHKGIVAFASNQVDSSTGSIRVHARVPNPDHTITPGAFARIHLEVSEPRPVLLINDSALQSRLAMRYVLVVDDHGLTSFRPVTLGEHEDGNLVVVEGGLKPSERIAVQGLAKIFFPGMPVSPQLLDMEKLTPIEPTQEGAPAQAPAPDAAAPPAAGAPAKSSDAKANP